MSSNTPLARQFRAVLKKRQEEIQQASGKKGSDENNIASTQIPGKQPLQKRRFP